MSVTTFHFIPSLSEIFLNIHKNSLHKNKTMSSVEDILFEENQDEGESVKDTKEENQKKRENEGGDKKRNKRQKTNKESSVTKPRMPPHLNSFETFKEKFKYLTKEEHIALLSRFYNVELANYEEKLKLWEKESGNKSTNNLESLKNAVLELLEKESELRSSIPGIDSDIEKLRKLASNSHSDS